MVDQPVTPRPTVADAVLWRGFVGWFGSGLAAGGSAAGAGRGDGRLRCAGGGGWPDRAGGGCRSVLRGRTVRTDGPRRGGGPAGGRGGGWDGVGEGCCGSPVTCTMWWVTVWVRSPCRPVPGGWRSRPERMTRCGGLC